MKILLILLFVFTFLIGILTGIIYMGEQGYQKVEGLWTKNIDDYKGEWIHVNIDGMSFERARQVCQHEVGHEIFAEVCEKNWTKCEEVIK